MAATEEEGRKMPDVEVKEVMGGCYNGQIMWTLEALAKHLECQGSHYSFEEKRNIIPLKIQKDHLVQLHRQETHIEVVRLVRRP